MVCKDGSSWDIAFYGWDCCSSHQGRAQCPSNIPIMCADLSCNGDHCCDNAGTSACNTMGGVRQCIFSRTTAQTTNKHTSSQEMTTEPPSTTQFTPIHFTATEHTATQFATTHGAATTQRTTMQRSTSQMTAAESTTTQTITITHLTRPMPLTRTIPLTRPMPLTRTIPLTRPMPLTRTIPLTRPMPSTSAPRTFAATTTYTRTITGTANTIRPTRTTMARTTMSPTMTGTTTTSTAPNPSGSLSTIATTHTKSPITTRVVTEATAHNTHLLSTTETTEAKKLSTGPLRTDTVTYNTRPLFTQSAVTSTTTTSNPKTNSNTRLTSRYSTTKAQGSASTMHCSFTSSSGRYNVMVCNDGSSWDVGSYGWDCCSSHQGRAQCPSNKPVMCADQSCYGDHCCDFLGLSPCSIHGGPRLCSEEATTRLPTTAVLDCPFIKNSGNYNIMACKDGSSWDVGSYGWDCCSSHQGRAQCPSNIPVMCADLSCNGDHCCDNAGTTACNTMGGARLCSKLLALYTYKSSGDAYIYIYGASCKHKCNQSHIHKIK